MDGRIVAERRHAREELHELWIQCVWPPPAIGLRDPLLPELRRELPQPLRRELTQRKAVGITVQHNQTAAR